MQLYWFAAEHNISTSYTHTCMCMYAFSLNMLESSVAISMTRIHKDSHIHISTLAQTRAHTHTIAMIKSTYTRTHTITKIICYSRVCRVCDVHWSIQNHRMHAYKYIFYILMHDSKWFLCFVVFHKNIHYYDWITTETQITFFFEFIYLNVSFKKFIKNVPFFIFGLLINFNWIFIKTFFFSKYERISMNLSKFFSITLQYHMSMRANKMDIAEPFQ